MDHGDCLVMSSKLSDPQQMAKRRALSKARNSNSNSELSLPACTVLAQEHSAGAVHHAVDEIGLGRTCVCQRRFLFANECS